MNISEKLANLNWNRNQAFQTLLIRIITEQQFILLMEMSMRV